MDFITWKKNRLEQQAKEEKEKKMPLIFTSWELQTLSTALELQITRDRKRMIRDLQKNELPMSEILLDGGMIAEQEVLKKKINEFLMSE